MSEFQTCRCGATTLLARDGTYRYLCDNCFSLLKKNIYEYIVDGSPRNLACLCGRKIPVDVAWSAEKDSLLDFCSIASWSISETGQELLSWQTDCCRRPFLSTTYKAQQKPEQYAIFPPMAVKWQFWDAVARTEKD